jgi:hypothetical protein
MRTLMTSAAVVAALAAGATPAVAKTKSFRTPSKNIYCLYMSTQGPGPWIRCDVLSLNDTGFRVDRKHHGKRIHITDSVVNRHAKVLHYGKSLDIGPFLCVSHRTGLNCEARLSGHGFEISRTRHQTF